LMTYAEIGKELGYSREWVRLIERSAIRKLKKAIAEDRDFIILYLHYLESTYEPIDRESLWEALE
jgi:hypothetical protein